QGFLTGTRGQARVLAPRQVISPRFSRHLNTPREISPLWEGIPCLGVQVPPRTHEFPISARFRACCIVTRAEAPASARRSAFRAFSSFLVRALQPALVCLHGDGLGSLGGARLQGRGG